MDRNCSVYRSSKVFQIKSEIVLSERIIISTGEMRPQKVLFIVEQSCATYVGP